MVSERSHEIAKGIGHTGKTAAMWAEHRNDTLMISVGAEGWYERALLVKVDLGLLELLSQSAPSMTKFKIFLH